MYKQEVASMSCNPDLVAVQAPRNAKQVRNLRFKHLNQTRISRDALYCGAFAIAFTLALCCGHPPGKFHFHQKSMRRHLIRCFERGHFTMFPVHLRRRNENRVKTIKTIDVYCTCRVPELSDAEMIQCSRCREWYHIDICVNVDKKARASKVPWYCITCA